VGILLVIKAPSSTDVTAAGDPTVPARPASRARGLGRITPSDWLFA
jgi:hypothetical protein